MKFGLERSSTVPCVYASMDGNIVTYLGLYVDDVLMICSSIEYCLIILDFMKERFSITINDAKCFIGFEIEKNEDTDSLFIHQRNYTQNILKRFNMENCKPVSTPSDPHITLNINGMKDDSLSNAITEAPHKKAVGALMYLATHTRPDIAYSVGKVAQYMANPRKQHWTAVKHIFRYLHGTIDGILFERQNGGINIEGFSDSDYARDVDSRRSTTGLVFLINKSPISWSSRIQDCSSFNNRGRVYGIM